MTKDFLMVAEVSNKVDDAVGIGKSTQQRLDIYI